MSRITEILAWIEADGYRYEKNNKHFETYNPEFVKMFCHPQWTGSKNPDWYLGGASINYCNIEEWIEQFEDFIKGFDAFGACALISHGDGNETIILGYELDERFKKKRLDFGEIYDHSPQLDIDFPAMFRLIHHYHSSNTSAREEK